MKSGSQPREARRFVYCSIAAQWDNLGDIEIRKVAVQWYAESGSSLVVYVGDMPESYIATFDLPAGTLIVRKSARYGMHLWRDIVRRRASIAFAPGPQVLSHNFRSISKTILNMINVGGVKISGGKAVAVGRSLRGAGVVAINLERTLIRMFDIYTVRDDVSSGVVHRDLRRTPDLAFFGVSSAVEAAKRSKVVMSFRGDRLVDSSQVKNLVGLIRESGHSPIFVSQVKRDDDQHAALAAAADAPAVLWGERSHSAQLDEVERQYSNTHAVISNRLHALLMGLQHGALPIGVVDVGSDKLTSTLISEVPLIVCPTNDLTSAEVRRLLGGELVHAREKLLVRALEAKSKLESLRREIVDLLA